MNSRQIDFYVSSLFDRIPPIGPQDDTTLHFYFEGAGDDMLSVLRNVSLLAHFPNFDENTGLHKTVLTIVCPDKTDFNDLESLREKLSRHLGNLPEYCSMEYKLLGSGLSETIPEKLETDLKFEIIGGPGAQTLLTENEDRKNAYVIRLEELQSSNTVMEDKDLLKELKEAQKINLVYKTGSEIQDDNVLDFDNVNKYETALSILKTRFSKKDTQAQWDQLSNSKKISNIYCHKCLKLRYKWLSTALGKDIFFRGKKMRKLIAENINALASCEHARWNVEELILGYRPLDIEQRNNFNNLAGKERDAYFKKLKNGPLKVHADICSYSTLRRTRPNDMKYDYFIVMAIPFIFG